MLFHNHARVRRIIQLSKLMSYQWVLCSALRNIHTRARPRESYPRAKQYSCLHRTQNPSKIDLTVDVKHIFENILLIHKVKKTICMIFH